MGCEGGWGVGSVFGEESFEVDLGGAVGEGV